MMQWHIMLCVTDLLRVVKFENIFIKFTTSDTCIYIHNIVNISSPLSIHNEDEDCRWIGVSIHNGDGVSELVFPPTTEMEFQEHLCFHPQWRWSCKRIDVTIHNGDEVIGELVLPSLMEVKLHKNWHSIGVFTYNGNGVTGAYMFPFIFDMELKEYPYFFTQLK